ncbi:MAG: PAS domain-containing protein [Janthinobacterium lividum]
MDSTPHALPYPPQPGELCAAGELLDALPWGMLVLDEQRIIGWVNQQAVRWCGAPAEALLGQPLASAPLPPALRTALLQLLEPAEAATREVYLPEQKQWLALSATRPPTGWALYGQDITSQKQREQHYQALADNTPDVLTRWTPDLRLRDANAAFAARAGQPVSVLLGRTFGEISMAAADVTGPYMAALQRVFDTGQPQEHHNSFAGPQGTVYFYSRLVPELCEGQVETVLGIARDTTELRQTQAEALGLRDGLMQHATDQYHALFQAMDQGFCVLEVLLDEAGQQALDFRYLELNPMFARQSGMPADVEGKTARQLLPDLEPFWFDTYGQVARSGEAVRVEHYVPQVGRWFDVHAFRVGAPEAHRVAVLFNDITARKEGEQQLHHAFEANAFRLRLADALSALADPVAIQETVTHLAWQHFAVDRCYYCEIEGSQVVIRRDAAAAGLPSVAGTYLLADFALLQAVIEAGQPFSVRDVRDAAGMDPNLRQLCLQLQVISYLNVPIIKNGQPVGVLCLVQSTPREWAAADVALAAEVAERTWVAVEQGHAKEALRLSEERQACRLQLSDALRALTSPAEIQATAARVLGQYLGVDRVYYVDLDEAAQEVVVGGAWYRLGAPGHAQRYPLSDWAMPWLQGGQTWVCHDVDTDPALPNAQRPEYRANNIGAAVVVPLLRHGRLAATLVANQGTPRAWAPQEVALAEETMERTWVALERARAEEALARSEAKYRTLFNSIDEGFTTVEVLFDDAGQAVDYQFLELNEAHERITGVPRMAVGKRVRELTPDLEEGTLRRLERVVLTGEPVRYEEYVQGLDRWFEVYSSRVGGPGSRTVANISNDTTARKRYEANLAFLAALNVEFAPLLNAEQIMARVNEPLADYLQLSRCHLALVDAEADHLDVIFDWRRDAEHLPPLRGVYSVADYLTAAGRQQVEAGQPLVLSGQEPSPLISTPPDVLARMGFGASVDIPHLIDGRWRFLLTVARAQPGPWRPDEVELLQQLAARIYTRLERAQVETALQEAHTQLVGVLESTHDSFYALDAEMRFTYANQRAAQRWGREVEALLGQCYWEAFPQVEGSESYRQHRAVLQTRQPAHFETVSPILDTWIEVSIYPGHQGGVSVFFRDISARKQAEERQAFLLRLSDAVRPLAEPAEIQAVTLQLLGQQLQLDRCGYAEIHADNEHATVSRDYYVADHVSFAGTYRLADLGARILAALQRGETLVVEDVVELLADADQATAASYVAHGMRAFVATPLLKHDRLIAILFAHHRQPRGWTPVEVALLEETAERTWAAVERSRAEEAQRESELRLRAIMENLPGAAVFIVDPALRYQLAEGEALRQAGYEPADFVGRPVQELALPHLWPDYQRNYGQALVGQRFEYEHEQAGRTFSTRGGPLRDAAGAVVAVLAVSYDITARQQAEAAVRKSEERFRLFVTASSDILYRMDANWQHLLTLDGRNLLADTASPSATWLETYIPLGDQATVQAAIQAAVDGHHFFELEHRIFRADGSVGWTFSRAVPVLNEYDELAEWFGTFTDITARRQAEEALRLSQQRLSLALQAGRMGSFEWTSAGNRISLSAMSEEVLGLVPGHVFATTDEGFGLVHPDDRARHQAVFEHAGHTGEDFHSIFRIVRPRDGVVRWIEERGQGAHDPSVGGICLRGVHWDVTEAMLAQERLAEFNTKLERRVARRTRELQASRDLLQSVFDTSLLAISVLEAVRDATGAVQDFRLRLVSQELTRETGRTDLVGKLYAQEYPGIREVGIFDLVVRAVETGEPQGMEYYYHYEGFDKWFACQFVKLGDGVVATSLDITERKTAEQDRMKNLRLLEQAEAVAGLGSWDYELATGTMRWSDGMYHLFGLPVGSVVSPAAYLSVVVPEHRVRAKQLVRRLTKGAGDFEETLRLRVGDRVKTVRMRAVVLHDEQGQAVRVLGVDLDISELRRLEHDNLRLRLRQQRTLFEAVQAAQEAERKRMAESLHNGIGQILYATKLRLDRLHAPLLGTDPTLAAARNEADQLLGEAIRQTRALSHELVPMVLTEFGLAPALKDICRTMSSPKLRFRCVLQLDDDVPSLTPALQMALYRMAQELAQNIVKHATGATEAGLELETMPGWVLLRAEDNGLGFSPGSAEGPGLGLRSIRDRVTLLGGQLESGSALDGGAYVRIRIPLPVPSTP